MRACWLTAACGVAQRMMSSIEIIPSVSPASLMTGSRRSRNVAIVSRAACTSSSGRHVWTRRDITLATVARAGSRTLQMASARSLSVSIPATRPDSRTTKVPQPVSFMRRLGGQIHLGACRSAQAGS
jgi:hypothetical protein